MRFLSYLLVFAFAVAVTVPKVVQAQDHVIHIAAVPVPSMVSDNTESIVHHHDDDAGTINAPPLLYSQDQLSRINDAESSIVTTILSPMNVAVDAEATEDNEDDDDQLSTSLDDESLIINADDDDDQSLIDDHNDDQHSNELSASTDEELAENGVNALFATMSEAADDDDDDDTSINAEVDDDDDTTIDDIDIDDDQSSFETSADASESSADSLSTSDASSSGHLKYRRPRKLRRSIIGKKPKFPKWPGKKYRPYTPLKKRLEERRKMLKLLVLAKKLKTLDMKMNLMKLISSAIRLRMKERAARGLMTPRRLLSLHQKLMKKLMVLKMIKLMHLVYHRMKGFPIYHPSGFRLSPRFLLKHFLRHSLRYPALAKIILRLKLKSLLITKAMKYFALKLKSLVKKLYLLKKARGVNVNKHRLFVKADRAIVNLGDGNEFKPVFYKSREGRRVSRDDNSSPVNVRVVKPAGITGRFRVYADDQ